MKRMLRLLGLIMVMTMVFPASALASDSNYVGNDLIGAEQSEFELLIAEIQNVKDAHPEYTDDMVLKILDEQHQRMERGLVDIWNVLTDSEKKLCIRYPFDALKVNTAKNIATLQTETKFGFNGLGDRSDAFRHGI